MVVQDLWTKPRWSVLIKTRDLSRSLSLWKWSQPQESVGQNNRSKNLERKRIGSMGYPEKEWQNFTDVMKNTNQFHEWIPNKINPKKSMQRHTIIKLLRTKDKKKKKKNLNYLYIPKPSMYFGFLGFFFCKYLFSRLFPTLTSKHVLRQDLMCEFLCWVCTVFNFYLE